MKAKPRNLDKRHKPRRANKLKVLDITEEGFVELPPPEVPLHWGFAERDAARQTAIDAELVKIVQWVGDAGLGDRVSLPALFAALHFMANQLPVFFLNGVSRLLEWHLRQRPTTRDQQRYELMRAVSESENLPLWSDACVERASEIAGKHQRAVSRSTMERARKIGSKKQREQRERLLQLSPRVRSG
jgi:hypothetical protein